MKSGLLPPPFVVEPRVTSGGSGSEHLHSSAGAGEDDKGTKPAEGNKWAPAGVQSTPAITHQPSVQHDIATHPSAHPPAAVYVLCLLSGSRCSGVIALSPRSVKRDIAHHLSLCHGIPSSSASSAPVRECTWLGCGCALRGPRCGSRPQGHAAHIKDLADHIMYSHLDFFYACDRCGRAEWASPYALSRHRRRCRGRVAARCTGCNDLLASQSALASHVERKECSAAPVWVECPQEM